MYAEWKNKIFEKYDFLSVEFLWFFFDVRIYEYIWISFELINELK